MMKNIIIPIDFSEISIKLIQYIQDYGKSLEAATLHFIHIIPLNMSYVIGDMSMQYIQDVDDDLINESTQKLAQIVQNISLNHTQTVIRGIPSEEIIEKAHETNADLIIMGSHGHGLLYEALVGSVTHEVLQETNIPLLIIPNKYQKKH